MAGRKNINWLLGKVSAINYNIIALVLQQNLIKPKVWIVEYLYTDRYIFMSVFSPEQIFADQTCIKAKFLISILISCSRMGENYVWK